MKPTSPAVLHLLCGKIASGKSTLARQLAEARGNILICEDQWLAGLYPDQIHSIPDYVLHAQRLGGVLEPLIVAVLRSGTGVVLDFPANTLAQRAWLRALAEQAGSEHQLHVLNVDEEQCKARLRERNRLGDHPFVTSEEQFERICRYFVPPQEEEGLNIILH